VRSVDDQHLVLMPGRCAPDDPTSGFDHDRQLRVATAPRRGICSER
jgi:hypothetical protein